MRSNITLRQLRAFVEVVRSAGFTAAARKLHLTQSATSLLVRELETQVGLQVELVPARHVEPLTGLDPPVLHHDVNMRMRPVWLSSSRPTA